MSETTKPDREVEIERVRLDAEVRKDEARAKVRQVIYGTMIVGLAAAAFPFAQKLAELSFTARIEQAKLEVESQRVAIEEERERRSFLNSLADEARSQEIERRIILAEFFSHMALNDEEREQWREFLNFLHERQRELNLERRDLIAKTVDTRTTASDYALAQARLEQITRLEAPQVQPARESVAGDELYDRFIRGLSPADQSGLGLDDPRVRGGLRALMSAIADEDLYDRFDRELSAADRWNLGLDDARVQRALRALLNDGPDHAEFARRLMAEAGVVEPREVTVEIDESDPVFSMLRSRLRMVGIELISDSTSSMRP